MANVLRNPLRSPIRGPLRSAIRNAIQGRLFYSWSGTSLESGYGNASMPTVGDNDYDRNTFDHLGIVRYLKAEEMPVVGMRRVENLLSASEDFSDASWDTLNTASVTGTNTLNFPAVSDEIRQNIPSLPYQAGVSVVHRVELSGSGTITIGATNGVQGTETTVTLSSSPQTFIYAHTFTVDGPSSRYRIIRRSGDTTEVTANFAQLENTTGSPSPSVPSEYCSSDTDYGWNTTGVRYFTYLNPLSVDGSGIVNDTGTRTPIDPSIIKGYGPQGLVEEISGRSADFSNWTAISTAQVSQDAVGLTGAENEAFTVTDSNAGVMEELGENTAIANDSNTRYEMFRVAYDASPAVYPRLWLRLLGGTVLTQAITFDPSDGSYAISQAQGSVEFVVRKGVFWYVLLSVVNNSSGNVTSQARVAPAYNTDGSATQDVTAQGSTVFASCELYKDNWSFRPILTTGGTTQTMLADTELTLPFDFTQIDAEGGCTFQATMYFEDSSGAAQGFISPNSSSSTIGVLNTQTARQIRLRDGLNAANLSSAWSTTGQTISVDLTWSTANAQMSIAVDGGTPVTAAYDGSFDPSGLVTIFKSLDRMAAIKNVRFYKG